MTLPCGGASALEQKIAPVVPSTEKPIDGSHIEPLVSAAEFHNREVEQRHTEQTLHHIPTGSVVEHRSSSPHLARAVERQSWMDAQSVERERLEEEYENESRVHADRSEQGRSPVKKAVELNGTPAANSEKLVEIGSKKDVVDREEVKGKEAKDRSEKKAHKHRHKHHHGHRKHGHKDKHHGSPPRDNVSKGDNGSARSPEPMLSRSATATTQSHQGSRIEETKPLPAKPPPQFNLNAPLMSSAPWDLPPTINVQGLPPLFYPPILNSGQYPPPPHAAGEEQMFRGQAAMPMQGFAWGAQAQQAEPYQDTSHGGNSGPNFTVPQYGQSPGPSLLHQSNGIAPPVIHDETCSPRTLPNARFPFPPFAPTNHVSSSSEQMPGNERSDGYPCNFTHQGGVPGLTERYAGGQWPIGMPPPPFAGMPYGAYFPPARMPVPAGPVPSNGARSEQDQAIQSDTAIKSAKGASRSTSSVRTHQEGKGESDQELARLRDQMKKNAEKSRQAIDMEKERSALHEQRLEALAKLAGSRRKGEKQRNGADSDKSGLQKKSKNGAAVRDIDPTYVETPEGFIKTYERVEVMTHKPEHDNSTPSSTKASSRKPQPRRMTQQTQKTVETQPTFTSGPSFGHYGRPFSHEFEDGTPVFHAGFPIDSFPVDPARIVIMQRTVEAKPGFGVPVSALGGFGLGMGIFSSFDEASDERPQEEHSRRSAYVETVSDEEVPRGGHSSQKTGYRATPEVASGARPERGQEHDGRQDLFLSDGNETPRTSAASLQGSLVLKEAYDSSTTLTHPMDSVPPPNPNRFSQALTTASLVDQLVQNSQHHDETLCQLLMAARDPKLGDAAKRAVRHAARDRLSDESVSTFRGKNKPLPAQPKEREDEVPAWSQALFEMLAETQTRLDELDARLPHMATRENTDSLLPEDDFAETQARAALHNLLFPDLPMEIPFFIDQYGNPHTSHHIGSSRNHVDSRESRGNATSTGTGARAKVETLFTDGQSSENTAREGDRRANITDSKADMSEWVSDAELPDRYVTAYSTVDPPVLPVKAAAEAMPIIRIQSPTTNTTSNAGVHRSRGASSPVPTRTHHDPEHEPLNDVTDASHTGNPIPYEVPPSDNVHARRDVGRQAHEGTQPDSLWKRMQRSRAWDIVGQRLFSWALVWPAEDFYRSLKAIALNQQVDEFALTIYMMTIFKRKLRHRLCAVPPLPCDKLLVPPNMCMRLTIGLRIGGFREINTGLRESVQLTLRGQRSFDLSTGRLVTMNFSHEEKSLIDGHHLGQETRRILTSESAKQDNSLAAANAARNLFLGWKPERPTEMHKLRELVWQEVYSAFVFRLLAVSPCSTYFPLSLSGQTPTHQESDWKAHDRPE
ncbi:hypothetical protein QFC21_001371 [Naganishia friedmannii]|uniref:Uncharacterized protein n=1 Tax=Naganishia friedmannii TaxID=89922 RepID=A0ACC2W566_9TREE|nr:hypothetical protein QFC21_001371 [Naganishia friedmannii]